MGQKVHPYGFRLGYTKPWKSRWFVERDYDKLLLEDVKLKDELKDKLKSAGVSAIEIERPGNKLRADIEYGFSEARTTYGVIGVKTWIYRGEILTQKKREAQQPAGGF